MGNGYYCKSLLYPHIVLTTASMQQMTRIIPMIIIPTTASSRINDKGYPHIALATAASK